jgi:tripartite-type tricarboxylate transporter receptor subunit TctC
MKGLITRLLLAALMACGTASAQQVTKFVVPFAPGGGTDVYARLVAAEISKAGLQVIVENKVGASGNIASEYVARSRPDGLTVLIHSQPLIYNTVLFEKLSYDPMKDFVPVSHIGYQDIIIVGRPDLPYSNVNSADTSAPNTTAGCRCSRP